MPKLIAGSTGYPPDAYPIAYPSTSRSRSVPYSRSSSIHAPNAPGTQAASSPLPGTRSSPRSPNASEVAAAGAVPCPQSTKVSSRPAWWAMTGTSPPRPFRCGSVTWSTSPAATAASNALPPRSSTAMPAAEASQCVEATMPNVPASSGRVVNSGISPMARSSHHAAAGHLVCRLAERAGMLDDYSSPLFDHDKVQTHAHDSSRGAAGADRGHSSYRGLAHGVRQRAGAPIDAAHGTWAGRIDRVPVRRPEGDGGQQPGGRRGGQRVLPGELHQHLDRGVRAVRFSRHVVRDRGRKRRPPDRRGGPAGPGLREAV